MAPWRMWCGPAPACACFIAKPHKVGKLMRGTKLQVPFFESLGFRCPERKGIPDFLQEVGRPPQLGLMSPLACPAVPGTESSLPGNTRAQEAAAWARDNGQGPALAPQLQFKPSTKSSLACDTLAQGAEVLAGDVSQGPAAVLDCTGPAMGVCAGGHLCGGVQPQPPRAGHSSPPGAAL